MQDFIVLGALLSRIIHMLTIKYVLNSICRWNFFDRMPRF
jgi:hypothetical protein